VLVAYDGSVSYLAPPALPLTKEETLLLRFVSRGGVLGGVPRVVGDSWSIPNAAGGYSATANYRETGAKSERDQLLALDLVEKASGPSGFDGHTTGSLEYDGATLVPITAHVSSRTQSVALATTITTDERLDYTRVSDTFASRAPAAQPSSSPAP
jgi:hypothetical protein